jgi:hypothetical protein
VTPSTSFDGELELEAKIAGCVRSYFQALQGGDSSEQQEALNWVCTGLEFWLGSLLEGHEGWYGWVDGIYPATDYFLTLLPQHLQRNSRYLVLRWERHGTRSRWVEPFAASLLVSDAADSIIRYEVKFGDAARGLGNHSYEKHIRRTDWFCPAEWMFSFTKGSDDTTTDQERN